MEAELKAEKKAKNASKVKTLEVRLQKMYVDKKVGRPCGAPRGDEEVILNVDGGQHAFKGLREDEVRWPAVAIARGVAE